MNVIALLAANLVALQGQAVQLSQPHEPGLEAVEVRWNDHTIPYVRRESEWITVVGVDLDTNAGEYYAEIGLCGRQNCVANGHDRGP
jgi:hypothetical protein